MFKNLFKSNIKKTTENNINLIMNKKSQLENKKNDIRSEMSKWGEKQKKKKNFP